MKVELYDHQKKAVDEEEWAEIKGFPNYMISDLGRVCNWRTDRVLKPRSSGWGYLQVILRSDGRSYTKSIHLMVAEVFVPGWDHGLEPNHKDGDKSNNHASNLEWETKGGNNLHAIRTGLRQPRHTPVRIVETGVVFDSVKDCAEHINAFPSGVSGALRGRSKTYKGYTFQYED